MASDEASIPACDSITIGSLLTLDMIEKNLEYVVTGASTVCVAQEKSSKKQRTYETEKPVGKNKCIENDPEAAGRVARAVMSEVEYFRKHVFPQIGKNGRVETYVKTLIVCVVRAAVSSSLCRLTKTDLVFCKAETEELLNAKIVNRQPLGTTAEDSLEQAMQQEAISGLSAAIYKIWDLVLKGGKGAHSNRFNRVTQHANLWAKFAKVYAEEHVHFHRDLKVSFTRQEALPRFGTAKVVCDTVSGCKVVLDYGGSVEDVIADYLFKLVAELAMSPHIHVEWKIDMAKFVSEKSIAMLNLFKNDIMGAAFSEDMGPVPPERLGRRNLTSVQPPAAKFWDFCRSSRPPSDVRYAMTFHEPISDPCASSGAGAFVADGCEKCKKCIDAPHLLSRLLRNEDTSKNAMTVRTWVECGQVLMFNVNPVTCAYAVNGFGERRCTYGMSKAFFASSIARAIQLSYKRKRIYVDKGGQQSDILSDGSSIGVKTVGFGTRKVLDDVVKSNLFCKILMFESDIRNITDTQLKLYDTVANEFPD